MCHSRQMNSWSACALQARLLSVQELGNVDSQFKTISDMDVHYTLQVPADAGSKAEATAVHCYHGFGANTASWAYMRQPLADALAARVTAHDMPGFGLTQRWAPLLWLER